MIRKKTGVIGELIYEHTIYEQGAFRRNLSYGQLGFLIDRIINTNERADITITPCYENARVEDIDSFGYLWGYEDFLLSESLNNEVTEEDLRKEILRIRGVPFENMTQEQKYVSTNTVRIYPNGDIVAFQQCLHDYIKFLQNRIPVYFEEMKTKL